MMYCTNCGHENPDNSRFCEQCGAPLQAGQQTPPSRPQYPPSSPQYPPSGPQYPPSGPQYPPSGPQYPPSRPQYPPSGPQYPPNRPGMGYQQPSAASTTPIWVLVSVIAGAAVILGFLLPWISVSLFGYGESTSGLTFIFNILGFMFSGMLSWLSGGQAFLLVVAFLIIIGILVLIAAMAVMIILAGVKLLGNHAVLPGESSQAAEKIKRYSIIGLIAVGVYFLLVVIVVGLIIFDGLLPLNTLAFGFWLCLLGFGAALLGVTVVKEKF